MKPIENIIEEFVNKRKYHSKIHIELYNFLKNYCGIDNVILLQVSFTKDLFFGGVKYGKTGRMNYKTWEVSNRTTNPKFRSYELC